MNVEYLLKLKAENKLTNEQIAERSGIPTSTLARVFNGSTDNPCFNTVVDIVRALHGSVDTMEHLRPETELSDTTQDTDDDKLIDLYKETIENKERWIRFLVGVLLGVGAFVLFILAYDIMHPFSGWIQY